MAAGLLIKLVDKTVKPSTIITWLTSEDIKGNIFLFQDTDQSFSSSALNKHEFVPFFLNFIRDQASAFHDCKTSSLSPLKTPISVFRQKSSGKSVSSASSHSNCKTPNTTPRVQLFSPVSARVSYETPPHEGFERKWGAGSNNTSASPSEMASSNGRKDYRSQKRNLGDFISPASSGRAGRKPRFEDFSPSHGPRRSVGRSKCLSSGAKNPARIDELNESPPSFNLASADDFPDVTKLKETPKQNKQAQSRRIIPTQIITMEPSSNTGTSFTKITDVPAPAKVMPRSIWAKPPENIAALNAHSGKHELCKLMKRLQVVPGDEEKSLENGAETRSPLNSDEALRLNTNVSAKTKIAKNSFGTPENMISGSSSSAEVLAASPDHVTQADKLLVLADFYSQCIREGLVSNVTVELYFLVQLLTVRGLQTSKDEVNLDAKLLSTVHNAVFFTTNTLLHLHSFLSLLERSTVRLMAENVRIAQFSPKLKDVLTGISEQPINQSHGSGFSFPVGGIIFQPEMDNRQNFPSDRSFHAFKKQRDLFYDLLREWEDKHLSIGWSMRESQSRLIRSLMDDCLMDLANCVHFVRLFVLQLMKMCSVEGNLEAEEKDAQLQLELKEANRDKLKRLQERLTTPVSTGGICPPPAFPGCQEFFRDFIVVAANHVFSQHLSDSLMAKIKELTKNSETNEYLELTDTSSAQEKHDELLQSLLLLRILGKFLGFVIFFPYRSAEMPQESTKLVLMDMRNEVLQPVCILSCLKSSIGLEQTLPSVVWIVDFLSQIDFVATELKYYTEVFSCLVDIYWSCCKMLLEQNSYAFFLIVNLLGWLFELKIFPELLFYRQRQKTFLFVKWTGKKMNSEALLSVLDQRTLYSCCPQLGEFRSLLLDFSAESGNAGVMVRKITPIKATSVDKVPPGPKKDIQKQMEENFFNIHSESLRQTVVFTANRIASNFVKLFQANVFPKQLQVCQDRAKEDAQKLVSSFPKLDPAAEADAKQRLMDYVQMVVQNILEEGKTQSESYCTEKVECITTNLLSEEMAPPVKALARQIAKSRAMKKINSWITENITLDMLMKDLMPLFDREVRLLSSAGSLVSIGSTLPVDYPLVPLTVAEHLPLVSLPSDVLMELKQALQSVLMGDFSLDSVRLWDLVNSVEKVIFHRQDLLANVFTHIILLSFNLACYIVFFRLDLWNDSIERLLVNLWESLNCCQMIETITSPKYMHSFRKSSRASQEMFVSFAGLLFEKKLLKKETLAVLTEIHIQTT